jgi:signal transduction histidine kinase
MGSLASSEAPATGGLDSRLIATIRLVLSSSVLFSIGPSEIEFSLDLDAFQIPSGLYTAYSAVLYVFAGRPIRPLLSKMSYSADVGWVALLIAFSDDLSLAFLFLFSTSIAAFQWSFVAALRLTLVAANLLVTIGFLKAQQGADLHHYEILLPSIYLIVLGYLLACWGAREMASKRRLVLLKEITRLSNPRFGIDRTIGTMIERLRAFHDAEACLMIAPDPASNKHLLYRGVGRDPERASEAESIPAETAELLLGPPLEQAMIYPGARHAWEWWRSPKASYCTFDVRKGRHIAAADAIDESLITIVDAESFISVPIRYSDASMGRLYLTAARRRAFSPADAGFLLQVVEQIVPVIDNIRLVDRLASSAAEEERRRLARDIHDNVIQSYIGFRIGLAAVSEKVQSGDGDIANDIAQLMTITDREIDALRRYVHRLPGDGARESVLLAAVQRFVTTFTEATDIAVRVEAASDLYIHDRLVAEVFQMVVEGLSNIRRHTQAACASIGLTRHNDCLMLLIANDGADAAPARFIPWSIAERAAALGGQVHVEHIAGGGTRVTVEIPL